MKLTKKIFKLTTRFCKDNGIYNEYIKNLKNFLSRHNEIKNENDFIKFLNNHYHYDIMFLVPTKKQKHCKLYVNNNIKKEIIKEFENFLKKENVYNEFIENINYNYFESHIDFVIKQQHNNDKNYYYNCVMPYNFIIRAFLWSQSKNVNETVWACINEEWLNKYKTLIFTL
jgi:hypothetical protein